ncbi:MAG: tryptophan-rich sensory protein [Oscillochloris sp.]|nr:tryptophan-rich sensory protein [Oscillochloris sp.]
MADLTDLTDNSAERLAADSLRQAAVIAALAATLTVNTLANTLPINGQTTADVSARFPLKITPPGYVFGIWGLIYSGVLGYAIYQALPAQRANPRLRRIGWLFIVSCAANIAWILLWHYNRPRQTLGAMFGILLALIAITTRLGKPLQGPLAERLLVRLPFSIYLGWISVATLVNVTVALSDLGWDGLGIAPDLWTVGLLGTGTALGAGIGALRGDPAFPLVLVWAFSGIAGKQADSPLVANAAWLATAASVLSALVGFWRGR